MTEEQSQSTSTDALFEGNPSTKPTVAAVITVAVLTFAIVVFLVVAGGGLIGETSGTLAGVIGVLGTLVLVRFFGQLYVLSRTSYLVTPTEIRRERELLFSRSSREIPVCRIRGVKMTQSPYQRFFGFGTVAVLTAGPNQSLGFVSLKQISDPVERRDELRTLVRGIEKGETSKKMSS